MADDLNGGVVDATGVNDPGADQDSNDLQTEYETLKATYETTVKRLEGRLNDVVQESKARKQKYKEISEQYKAALDELDRYKEQGAKSDEEINERIKVIKEKYIAETTEKEREVEALKQQVYDYRVSNAIDAAAVKHGALNPQQVRILLQHENLIRLDDNNQVIVLNPEGTKRYSLTASDQLMSIEEKVAEYLNDPQNLNLKRATTTPGSSSPQQPVSQKKPPTVDEKFESDKQKAITNIPSLAKVFNTG